MDLSEPAIRIKIYVGETDISHGVPAYKAVVDFYNNVGSGVPQ